MGGAYIEAKKREMEDRAKKEREWEKKNPKEAKKRKEEFEEGMALHYAMQNMKTRPFEIEDLEGFEYTPIIPIRVSPTTINPNLTTIARAAIETGLTSFSLDQTSNQSTYINGKRVRLSERYNARGKIE